MEIFPGYETLTTHLIDLATSCPPPFIYIHDPFTSQITAFVTNSIIASTSASATEPPILYARANAISSFTPRLLYDSILNGLMNWEPTWEGGCQLWGTGTGRRWNDSIDGFVHGLRAVCSESSQKQLFSVAEGSKGKSKARLERPRIVIIIERAERLKTSQPDLIVPLTRLAELAQLDLTVIFISDVRWQDIKPVLGGSPDPFHIDILAPTKQATLQMLVAAFPQDTLNSYSPVLSPLYQHFASTLYDVCSPFIKDPHELIYIAAARWPGFVRPILDEYQRLQQNNTQDDPDRDEDEGLELTPPSEDVRIRLIRFFTPSFTAALEALYPRLSNAADWAELNKPRENLLSSDNTSPTSMSNEPNAIRDPSEGSMAGVLPKLSKFILIAAFLASTNPQKTDMRMFGRGPDERKKKRKRGGIAEPKKGGAIKIPQRLLGPTPFPLDRMISILGVILEEYDADDRPHAPEYSLPGEYTDMEIQRVSVFSSVTELTSMRLLHRTTPPDRLDGPPMFKCAVPYEALLRVARDLKVPLNDLMWEPA